MDIYESFVARYRKEYDFYDQAGRLAAQLIEKSLQDSGIRAIVTARAKSPSRLEQKIRQRASTKNYKTVEEIFEDIVDLAGVRIALYFPAERLQVDKVISQLFIPASPPKQFPEGSKKETPNKRFSGYWATHYRIRHKDSQLSDAQKRYADAIIEIQVASVLMHSWAEVEHDLIYKPLQGDLSENEYAILDELNGLVLAGEIALERLQKAGESRVAENDRVFSNHYDLAAFLLTKADLVLRNPEPETALGRINLLYRLLVETNKATPNKLKPYLGVLGNIENRPLADQIIDNILTEAPELYKIYESSKVREIGDGSLEKRSNADHESFGKFLTRWISLEAELRKLSSRLFPRDNRFAIPTNLLIKKINLDQDTLVEFQRVRRFRNLLVHGIEIPSRKDIDDESEALDLILKKIRTARKNFKTRPKSSKSK